MSNADESKPLSSSAQTEHPEDRKAREEGEAYGRAHAEEFLGDHLRQMASLIGTYADVDAHDKLDNLRESFWANVWVPSVKP